MQPSHAAGTRLVTRTIDDAERVSLAGHRAGWAKTANDRGDVPATLELRHLSLGLARPPERQRAFDAYLAELRDPSSPNYRRWLTPSEIGERFGPDQADIDAASDWLRSRGLAVDGLSNSRTRLKFHGNAANVGAAFGTTLRYFQDGSERRMAPAGEPEIPAALAAAVADVNGLSPPRFGSQRRSEARVSASAAGTSARPALTNCDPDTGACEHYITPGDFSKIYNLAPVYAQGYEGTGQTIAIIGRSRVFQDDLDNFAARTGTTLKTPTVIVPPDGTDPGDPVTTCSTTGGTPSCDDPSDQVGDQGEATLDITRAGSVAPGANLKLIVSADTGGVDGLNFALDYAIDHEPVPAQIVSISYGSCEGQNSAAVANSLDQLFAQAAMEGISVFVSSGDAGAGDCADYFTTPAAGITRSTNVLCSSGYVTCVGGTSYADANGTYWSSSNSTGYVSALGYIPEGAWNEPVDTDGNPQVAATGGGVSAYLSKPSWQVGTGVPGSQGRYTPDVSFAASLTNGYFGCLAAQGGSCVVSNRSFGFIINGGTSASAPSMAGVAALLNQSRGGSLGNLNPTLYALATDTSNGVFHDVTVATSGVTSCSVSIPSLCNNSLPGPTGQTGGLVGYSVGTGYDLATGLGSIDVGQLVDSWGETRATVNLNQHGITGSWADPSTDSQGFLLELYPDFYATGRGQLFAGWFTYDTTAAGGVRWYTVQGEVDASSDSATLAIQRTVGGRFDSSLATTTTQVGEATFQLDDCSHGTLSYRFDDGSGRSGDIPITRLLTNTSCGQSGDNGAAVSDYPLSGAWADTGNSGQGLVFDVNPAQSVFFAAWYTFSTTGQSSSGATAQRWFTLQAPMTPGATVLTGVPIYAVSGGVFDQPANTQTTAVGSAEIVFHSCTSATLTYAFSTASGFPSSGSLALTRVGPVPAGCSL